MKTKSDGSTADYYKLPEGATELQDLISHRDLNAQIGEIFRACYRYGIASHSDKLRDAKKILFYAQSEVKRLEAMRKEDSEPERQPAASGDKPSWNDAPEWAQWVAQDADGEWFWYEEKPGLASCTWYENDGEDVVFALKGNENPNWRETLEQRPSNDGWIQWNGGECPVSGKTIVEVKLEDGDHVTGSADCFEWNRDENMLDIIAYRVIK